MNETRVHYEIVSDTDNGYICYGGYETIELAKKYFLTDTSINRPAHIEKVTEIREIVEKEKMTIEEAKTKLEAYLMCESKKSHFDCSDSKCDDNCPLLYEMGTVGERNEAINMAINALEYMYEDWAEYEEYCKRKESEVKNEKRL